MIIITKPLSFYNPVSAPVRGAFVPLRSSFWQTAQKCRQKFGDLVLVPARTSTANDGIIEYLCVRDSSRQERRVGTRGRARRSDARRRFGRDIPIAGSGSSEFGEYDKQGRQP